MAINKDPAKMSMTELRIEVEQRRAAAAKDIAEIVRLTNEMINLQEKADEEVQQYQQHVEIVSRMNEKLEKQIALLTPMGLRDKNKSH